MTDTSLLKSIRVGLKDNPFDIFDLYGRRRTSWRFDSVPDMKGKIVLCTGATSGLGFEFTRHMAKHGAHIIMGAKTQQEGHDALTKLLAEFPNADAEVRVVELTDRNSIINFANGILRTYPHLDILCNNAGIGALPPYLVDGWNNVFYVDSVAPFLLTGLLLPLLVKSKSARIVFVSSIMYAAAKDLRRDQLQDTQLTSVRDRHIIYSYAKLANIFMVKEITKRLESAGVDTVVAAAAHPGAAATGLNHVPGAPMENIAPLVDAFVQSAEMGSSPLLFAATDPNVHSGDHFGPAGAAGIMGWPKKTSLHGIALDEKLQKKVWGFLEDASHFTYPI